MKKLWLKEYDKGVAENISGRIPSLPEMLKNTVSRFPERAAIKADGQTITYTELDKISSVIAGNLRLSGLERQNKVCVLLPNTKETILSFFAITRGAYVCVMTNPLYSEDELVHQINDSDSVIAITNDLLLPKMLKALPRTNITKVYVVKTDPNSQLVENEKVSPWESLLSDNRGYTAENIDVEEELAALQYTGGTTGISKGCMLTHKNVVADSMLTKAFFDVALNDGEEVFAGVLPFFHIYGLQLSVVMAVLSGATMVPLSRFTPAGLLNAIQNEKVTLVPAAPSIFSACLNQKNIDTYDLSSLKIMISGSSPLPRAQREAFESKTSVIISEGYGLSEASPVTHYTPIYNKKRRECSIGTPLPSTEVKIVDVEYGIKELGVNEDGEMCIKGPQVMKGYYKQPGQTEMVLRDGWLYTGDIAHFDEDGYFYITDRKKDLIISGGYNVYPREIEEVLYKHPKIKEAAVIGVADKVRGEIAKAFVVLKEGEEMDKIELATYCKQHLANYKVPRQSEFIEALPKTAVGKILKEELKKREAAKQN